MSPTQKLPISEARTLAQSIADAVGAAVLGKQAQIRLAVACLLARGHLLIEDVPGVGKTTLAHALSDACGLAWRRVQFTSDLLPADLVGVSIWDAGAAQFAFRPGPVFSEVLLADEVNRASPKTQSALLEAMEERRVSVDGQTHPLPEPFFVIATQNPTHHAGTFDLPESQLDRFLMRLALGYPPPAAELALLTGQDRRARKAIAQVTDRAQLMQLQNSCADVFVSEAIARYVLRLLTASRNHGGVLQGLSPRAGLSLLAAARAFALTEGRDFVAPEDVQAVWQAVSAHRLHGKDTRSLTAAIVDELLSSTPVA
ncbi:AAA family ATPase [Niveibacterium sp. 24ML]|uniref:AAA family ATPase n=1 Tax=Niveibacterium sp. 24ML TaxID=2985512 RepID=UPI00226D5EF7|nr:AAA family ATPase [Niveibacterium sp. 24ML]MCX9156060.1 AAA family ATPase [Niveibacterium sp. 24ML]